MHLITKHLFPDHFPALTNLHTVPVQKSQKFQGVNRTYWVHLPSSYNASVPLPVVLAFHGWQGQEFRV